MAAGDLFLEVWKRPGSAVFERIVAGVPGPYSFTKRMAGGVGQGDMTVPSTWDRINAVIQRVPGTPSSDVRTLNRVLMEQASGPATIAYEWFNDVTGDETREDFTQIQGPGIESLMADGIVYPWDWDGLDESTSTFPDWIWGGKDIVGPVETSFAPAINTVWIDPAATGTGNIDVSFNGGAFQSAGVSVGDSAFDVEQALEALTNVGTADVDGQGTEANPWQVRILDPPGEYQIAIDSSGLTGGRIYTVPVQFGKSMPIGWTESRVGSTTIGHGILTDFRASPGGGADPTLPAGCDNWVVFLGQEWYFPGVQKIVTVSPGGIFQVPPLWLYAQGASADLRIVIRDLNENLIAFEEITVPSNTPTQTVGLVDVMIPEGITEVIFRIGHIGAGTPPRIFIACPEMREGLAPTTAGGIFDALFDDATVNHVADGRLVWEDLASPGTTYLDLTFDVSLDSDGVAWDEPELTFTAQRGKTYIQVLTDLNHLGYKWTVTAGLTPGRWDVNLYNPTWVDTDATALSTPAINIGSGVTGGPIFRSHLTGNVVTVEGSQMQFGRSESALSIAAIGRKEAYQPDRALLTTQMATLRAAEEVGSRLLSGLSVSVTVDPVAGPIPLLDYDVDWIINVQIPPVLSKSAHRLASITVNVGATTQYKLSFSSEAFAGVQGVFEGVRRLMLKFEGLERVPPEQRPADIVGGAGGMATVLIAASNATHYSQTKADYECSGTNDDVQIQTVINELLSIGGGTVWLSEGLFSCTAPLSVWAGINLRGLHQNQTKLRFTAAVTGATTDALNVQSTALSDMTVEAYGDVRHIIDSGNDDTEIENVNVRLDSGGSATSAINLNGGWLEDIDIDLSGPSTYGILHTSGNDAWLRGVKIDGAIDIGMRITGGQDLVDISGLYIDAIDIGFQLEGNSSTRVRASFISGLNAGLEAFSTTTFATFEGVEFVGLSGPAILLRDSTGQARVQILGGEASGSTDAVLIDGFTTESRATIVGLHVNQAGEHGIRLLDASGHDIVDCPIERVGGSADNTFDGIFLEGDSNRNQIAGNHVVANSNPSFTTRYAVNVSAAACDNNISDRNVAEGTFGNSPPYNDAGTGTQGTNFVV